MMRLLNQSDPLLDLKSIYLGSTELQYQHLIACKVLNLFFYFSVTRLNMSIQWTLKESQSVQNGSHGTVRFHGTPVALYKALK